MNVQTDSECSSIARRGLTIASSLVALAWLGCAAPIGEAPYEDKDAQEVRQLLTGEWSGEAEVDYHKWWQRRLYPSKATVTLSFGLNEDDSLNTSGTGSKLGANVVSVGGATTVEDAEGGNDVVVLTAELEIDVHIPGISDPTVRGKATLTPDGPDVYSIVYDSEKLEDGEWIKGAHLEGTIVVDRSGDEPKLVITMNQTDDSKTIRQVTLSAQRQPAE